MFNKSNFVILKVKKDEKYAEGLTVVRLKFIVGDH